MGGQGGMDEQVSAISLTQSRAASRRDGKA